MASALAGPTGDTLLKPAVPKLFHHLVLKGRDFSRAARWPINARALASPGMSARPNGFAVVVPTTTPWPRPTPAGVATARGGESPRACNGAQREWKAPWSAQTEHSAVRKTGDIPCGARGRSSLRRVSKGQALRTGHRSAKGVAQDAPYFTAARLEHRAGALTETVECNRVDK
jgi:hypothetical protein